MLSVVMVSANAKSYIAANVSTSLRLNADLIEIPQHITVATRQTLTDMGLLTKSEIFRIPGAITKSYGSGRDLTFAEGSSPTKDSFYRYVFSG